MHAHQSLPLFAHPLVLLSAHSDKLRVRWQAREGCGCLSGGWLDRRLVKQSAFDPPPYRMLRVCSWQLWRGVLFILIFEFVACAPHLSTHAVLHNSIFFL